MDNSKVDANLPAVEGVAQNPEDPEHGKPQEALKTSLAISLAIDDDEDTYLSSPPQTNTAEEELLPREVIASAVGSTNLQAELERPVKLGTFNALPAYLLRTRLTFQRTSTDSLYRIQAASVTIVFEDAPGAGSEAKNGMLPESNFSGAQHPAIAAWYPNLFEGEVSAALVSNHVEGSVEAGYMGLGAGVKVGQSKHAVSTSQVVVHGVRGGGRYRNAITWTIEENRIAKSGVPRDVLLPLVVTHRSRRFRARVTVKAHFGFWRGALARSVPVLGRNDEPLYFEPAVLKSMAERGLDKGPDGTLVAEEVGSLDGEDLQAWSSFTPVSK